MRHSAPSWSCPASTPATWASLTPELNDCTLNQEECVGSRHPRDLESRSCTRSRSGLSRRTGNNTRGVMLPGCCHRQRRRADAPPGALSAGSCARIQPHLTQTVPENARYDKVTRTVWISCLRSLDRRASRRTRRGKFSAPRRGIIQVSERQRGTRWNGVRVPGSGDIRAGHIDRGRQASPR